MQWTNSSANAMRPGLNPWGTPQIRYYQEATCAATAVIQVGHLVSNNTVVTTGGQRIVRAPSSAGNGSNLLEVLSASLIGVAVEDSTSNGSTAGLVDDSTTGAFRPKTRMIGVALADGQSEFLGYFRSGGAGTAPRALSSLIGLNRPVVLDSTLNLYFIDSTNSTAALVSVKITGFPNNVLGDTGGVPCYFKVLSSLVNSAVNAGGPSVA